MTSAARCCSTASSWSSTARPAGLRAVAAPHARPAAGRRSCGAATGLVLRLRRAGGRRAAAAGRAVRRAPGAAGRARPGGLRVAVPPSFTDVSGAQLLEVARGHRLEGVVAKRRASRYEPGRRSAAWVKTALFPTQEVLVGGWTAGEGRRRARSARCCSVRTTPTAGCATSATSAPGSPSSVARPDGPAGPLARPTSPFDEPVPREHARGAVGAAGAGRRGAVPALTRTAGCGTRRGAGCGRTGSPTRWSSRRPDRRRADRRRAAAGLAARLRDRRGCTACACGGDGRCSPE